MSSNDKKVKFFDAYSQSAPIHKDKNLKVIRYELITRQQLLELDKSNALVLVAISPLEVHGDYLPLGTDFIEARMMFEWIKDTIKERKKDKDYTIVEMPPIPLGWSGVRSMIGTIHTKHRTFTNVVESYLEGIVKAGFKRIFMTSAHHGNIHAYAMEEAAMRVMKKYSELEVRIASPLNWIVKKLMVDNPRKTWGDMAERLGDNPLSDEEYTALFQDQHASIMEISFVKNINPDLVDECYKEKEPYTTHFIQGIKKMFADKYAVLGEGTLGCGYNGHPARVDDRDWIPYYKALISDVGEEFVNALFEKDYEEFMEKYSRSFMWPLVFLRTNWKWYGFFIPLLIIVGSLLFYPLFPWNLIPLGLYILYLFLMVYRIIQAVKQD